MRYCNIALRQTQTFEDTGMFTLLTSITMHNLASSCILCSCIILTGKTCSLLDCFLGSSAMYFATIIAILRTIDRSDALASACCYDRSDSLSCTSCSRHECRPGKVDIVSTLNNTCEAGSSQVDVRNTSSYPGCLFVHCFTAFLFYCPQRL